MDQIIDFFKGHKPQCIFFLVFMAACVPVLYYYRRRNPNPRFRPTAGEMTLMSVFCAFICAGLSFGLGSVFNEHQDFRRLADKPPQDELTGTISTNGSGKRKSDDPDKKDAGSALVDKLKGSK